MALTPGYLAFINTLSSSAKNILKTTLQGLSTQIQVVIKSLDVKAAPINAKILVYEPYVTGLRTLYNTTKQAFTPIMAMFQGQSGGSGNALSTSATNRIAEFGIVNSAIDAKTLPIYKKLDAAETKLRNMKLQREQMTINKLKLEEQYNSIQEQIAAL